MGVVAVTAMGAGAVGAAAHIGGPGTGLPIATNGPDLRSVSVVDYSLTDTQPEQARYCFDANVATVGGLGGYSIFTYDTNRFFKPSAVNRATDDERCVVAEFPAGSDIAQGTVGSVDPGTVRDLQNRPSDYGSEPLGGSASGPRPGATTGPDLVGAEVNTTNSSSKRITYVFDESVSPNPVRRQATANPDDGAATELAPAPYTGNDFGFYNSAGLPTFGPANAASVDVNGNRVTVNFGSAPGVDTAVRLFSGYGAVQDRRQNGAANGRETFTLSSFGVVKRGETSRPDVVSVTPEGQQTYAIRFSTPIAMNPNTNGRIVAVSDDNSLFNTFATNSLVRNGDTLVVTFAGSAAADPNSIVRIIAADGAVDNATDGGDSIIGQGDSATPNAAPGFTAGPDLVSTSQASDRRVVYRYDERVDENSAGPGDFRAVSADGSATGGSGGVVVEGASVTVSYTSQADSAVGYTNAYAVLTDPTGRPSPAQSVSRDNEPFPPAPTPAQTPTTPPPPPGGTTTTPTRPTTPPGIKRSKFRTSFTSFRVKSRTRYSGRIASSGRGCKSGRRIALKRRGRTIRNGFTRGDGTFTIARTAGTRRKRGIYVVVTERSTKTATCTARSSKRLRRG